MAAKTHAGRTGLVSAVEQYLDAVAARDPSRAPLSPHVRFTENSQLLRVGDGFWATCNRRGVYSHVAADPSTQQAGVIGVMRENDVAVIFGLRIKLEDGLISEAETVVSRDPSCSTRTARKSWRQWESRCRPGWRPYRRLSARHVRR